MQECIEIGAELQRGRGIAVSSTAVSTPMPDFPRHAFADVLRQLAGAAQTPAGRVSVSAPLCRCHDRGLYRRIQDCDHVRTQESIN